MHAFLIWSASALAAGAAACVGCAGAAAGTGLAGQDAGGGASAPGAGPHFPSHFVSHLGSQLGATLADLPGGRDGAAVAQARAAYSNDVQRILALQRANFAAADSDASGGPYGGDNGSADGSGAGRGAADGCGSDIRGGSGSLPSDEDVLRLILAVQCNAFYSGLHVHCSMLNHGCRPRCACIRS
eukprot:364521-Chlamydomonas_euryale.AAC.12